MTHPDNDDVIVRRKLDGSTLVYVLRTHWSPDQVGLSTREEAVSQALAYAKRHHVRAWFAEDEDFVLLGTFLDASAQHAAELTPSQRCEACGGSLVTPDVYGLLVPGSPGHASPDYICVECQRPHYWRGKPPQLVSDLPTG